METTTTRQEIDDALSVVNEIEIPKGSFMAHLEIISVFVKEVILKVRKRFSDDQGNIRTPRGPGKWIRYGSIGLYMLLRVIRLAKDLAQNKKDIEGVSRSGSEDGRGA